MYRYIMKNCKIEIWVDVGQIYQLQDMQLIVLKQETIKERKSVL